MNSLWVLWVARIFLLHRRLRVAIDLPIVDPSRCVGKLAFADEAHSSVSEEAANEVLQAGSESIQMKQRLPTSQP